MALAGAWTQSKGDGLSLITFVSNRANAVFENRDGEARPTDFRKFEVESYNEFGLTDSTTLVLKAPYQAVRDQSGGEAERVSGRGEIELGIRSRLLERDGLVLSTQFSAGFAGRAQGGGQAPLAQAERSYRSDLLAGGNLKIAGRDAFWSGSAGYVWRAGAPPNEWRGEATLGVEVGAGAKILVQSFSTVSDGAGDGVFERFGYHKAQLSLLKPIGERWAVQVGGFRSYAGQNALKETGAFVSLWRRWGIRGSGAPEVGAPQTQSIHAPQP